jgi:hypothetical protein
MTSGTGPHPLLAILDAAADGRFPPADGACETLPPDGAFRAVVAFTGHAYVLADVDPAELSARGADGLGGASRPHLLQWVAGDDGRIGSLDVVLVATGSPGPTLPRRTDLDGHPRVRRAAGYRTDVRVHADDVGLLVLGRGLAGRQELSVELLDLTASSHGHGRRLIRAGLAEVAPGERCWAQVAPGNAASLRAFLACGFVPICSEVLIAPADPAGPARPD